MPPQPDCIVWTGATSGRHGYGHVRINGRDYLVHRLEWEKHNGPLKPGECVLHSCDNPPCYNIEHLFVGDKKANAVDRNAKGRNAPRNGTNNGRAKLTWPIVRDIRRRAVAGERQIDIANSLALSKERVHSVVQGITWKE